MMRRGRPGAAVLGCGLSLLLGAARAQAVAPPAGPSAWAIAPGNEALFLSMTDPKPARFAGAWALDGVAIERSVAVVTYTDGKGGKARLALAHPSVGGEVLLRTVRFALLSSGSPAPRALAEALAARVRQHEVAFQWTAVPGASNQGGNDHGWATVPDDAVPAARLRRLEYPLPDESSRRALEGAEALARQGKVEEARAAAGRLAGPPSGSPWPQLAAAMVLRAAGDGEGSAKLLVPLLARAGSDAERDRLRLELAAAEELAGRTAEAARVLGAMKAPPDGGIDCARAQALTLLVQEGRAREVLGRTAAEVERQPRCLLQARMRAAIAANDTAALGAAGAAAAKRDPKDANLLYLWGSSYYDRQDFQGARQAWDRLAAVRPDFPGFLGLYGTTLHVQGVLKDQVLAGHLARARANADDVIANHLAGIGLYYQRRYAEVIPLLENVRRHNDEPRAGMYLAMSHFFTGDVDGAIAMLDALEPVAHREPDIYYCRSLVWRFYDLPRAIREMQTFLDVFLKESRPAYGQQKIDKARDDLERMRRGEVPSVYLAGQGSYTPPPRRGAK